MTDSNNGLDQGVVAFGVWLKGEEAKDASNIPMMLRRFVNDRLVILHDCVLGKTVIVEIIEGIPSCIECSSTDCSHVGFAICVEQMSKRSMIE